MPPVSISESGSTGLPPAFAEEIGERRAEARIALALAVVQLERLGVREEALAGRGEERERQQVGRGLADAEVDRAALRRAVEGGLAAHAARLRDEPEHLVRPPLQECADVRRRDAPQVVQRRLRIESDVRRQQHVRAPHERMMPEVRRILSQHVERRAGDEAAVERIHEVGLDEERAARDVDEERLALHLCERGAVRGGRGCPRPGCSAG